MLVTSSMLTTLIIISMMQPLMQNSLLIPALLGKTLALKYALMVVPRIAIGAVIFGEGAAVIGGNLLWNYISWRRAHPNFRHNYLGHFSRPSSGWSAAVHTSPSPSWKPWLHERYNRVYNRGHRALDFLAWGLDKTPWVFDRVQDHVGQRAVQALSIASEIAKAKVNSQNHIGHGWPSFGSAIVSQAVKTIVGGSPVTSFLDSGSSHSYPPKSTYGGGSYEDNSPHYSPNEPYHEPRSQASSPHEHGISPDEYYSSDDGASHASSHNEYYSDAEQPEYASESSHSHDRTSQPLDIEEFTRLMAWASGEDYMSDQGTEGSSTRFVTEPLDPDDVHPPRVVRIKRDADKPENAKQDNFLKYLIEDVRRFFTIVTYLDENKCLQKLVCDVHSKAKSLSLPEVESKLTPYESNIITAFKILDTFMPPYEDSATNYRVAARLGMNTPTESFCSTYYDSCTYTAEDIIGFSNKIESNQIETTATAGKVDLETTTAAKV